jgi:glycosyltransferase involved in cell wall biosynthesis
MSYPTNIPKITVITVVRNGETTLEQTMLSVLNQTYSNIEYIVIDGASTDGTLNIVKRYDERIKSGEFPNIASRWISEPDKGIYDAMNKGIDLATGEIIGIINSDDWYELDCLENIVKLYDNDTILYGLIRIITNQEYFDIYSCSSNYLFKKMLPHPTVFIPKRIYDRYGIFDIGYKYCADYDLLLRLKSKNVKFHIIEKVLANFRIGGVSSTFNAQKESAIMRHKYGLISKKGMYINIIATYFKIRLRNIM